MGGLMDGLGLPSGYKARYGEQRDYGNVVPAEYPSMIAGGNIGAMLGAAGIGIPASYLMNMAYPGASLAAGALLGGVRGAKDGVQAYRDRVLEDQPGAFPTYGYGVKRR